jgi:branched-chain amino acid transport system substrate-binding protein
MKKKRGTRFSVICLVLVFSVCFVASEALAKEFKIGLHASFTGAGAMWGTAFGRAWGKIMEDKNKEGGLLVGGERYEMKGVKYDNKRDPAASVENTKNMIFKDKVQAILHHGGVCVTPVLPSTSEHRIITMDASVGPQVLRWPYNFNSLPAGRSWSLMALTAMKRKWGVKTVAEINPDSESGYTTEVDDLRAAKQLGMKMISHQFWPYGTTDFYPILTKALAAKPDLILIGLGEPGVVPLILKQARELGWKGPIAMSQGAIGSVDTAVKIAGKGAEDFIWCSPFHCVPEYLSKKQNEAMADYLEKYGPPFIPEYFLGFMQLVPLIQAIERANSFDPDKVAKALETGEFVVQGWKLHYVSTADCYMGRPRSMVFPFPVNTIKDGKNVLIDLVIPEGVVKVD